MLLLALTVFLGGCASSCGSVGDGTRQVRPDVNPPDCVAALTGYQLVSGVSRVPWPKNASIAVPAVSTPTLLVLMETSGAPVLAGFANSGDAQPRLNTLSTVVASAMLHPMMSGATGAQRTAIAARIAQSPAAQQLADELSRALCAGVDRPGAFWEFDSRYASNLLQLLMDAVQAEATSTTATRAAALSGCKGPSVPLPMGEYCTSDDDKLHIVSDKAIQYGARVRRGGADAIELVDGKTALVSLSPFSFAQPLRATTELDLPDPNSMVELHKGFPGPDCDLAQFDDFVGGCFVNIESDPRALATWANLTRGFFLALDVAGVIEDLPEYKAVAKPLRSLSTLSKGLKDFLRPLQQNPCLASTLQFILGAGAEELNSLALQSPDPGQAAFYQNLAAAIVGLSNASVELANALNDNARKAGNASVCDAFVSTIRGRINNNRGLIHARVSKAVNSGKADQIVRNILKELVRDTLNELPVAAADGIASGLSVYQIGQTLGTVVTDPGQALQSAEVLTRDTLLFLTDNQDQLTAFALQVLGAAFQSAADDLAGFLIRKLLGRAAIYIDVGVKVSNVVAPFVIDYASAPNATFCYGVSCDVVSDMRAAPTDLSTGSADMAVPPSCGDGTCGPLETPGNCCIDCPCRGPFTCSASTKVCMPQPPLWTLRESAIRGTPAIDKISASDYHVYAATTKGKLIAIDRSLTGMGTFTPLWSYQAAGTLSVCNSPPAVGADGTIYYIPGDNSVYAFKRDGTFKWPPIAGRKAPCNAPPAFLQDGTLVVVLDNGQNVCRVSKDSGIVGTCTALPYAGDAGAITIAPDQTLIVHGARSTNLITPTGTLRTLPNVASIDPESGGAVDSAGNIYLMGSSLTDWGLFSIAPNGGSPSVRWLFSSTDCNFPQRAAVFVDASGQLLFNCRNFLTVSASGALVNREYGDGYSGAVSQNGTLFNGFQGSKHFILRWPGVSIYYYNIPGNDDSFGGLTIAPDGVVFVGFSNNGGGLHALQGDGSPLSGITPWPKGYHDARNSGNGALPLY